MGSEEFYNLMMIKGKRSKRQRQLLAASSSSSLALTMATSSSSTSSSDQQLNNNNFIISCDDNDKTTQVEQDMANCLILLAQGGQSRKLPTATIKDLFMYQCKTCDRSFPSFQALGGHRASHKRPKAGSTNESSSSIFNHDASLCTTNTILSLQISSSRSDDLCGMKPNNGKSASKIHECSICGAEFTSGQALGGHMRRHRSSLLPRPSMPSPNHESENETKKPAAANVFPLDLNLPAPEDMDQQIESKFPFAMNEQVIVFSPSALVDCHL
ncbi:Ankyrin repeat family protein [Heracleum sosnowskyi]|uniref:Ankyrin repeat family protein n=1 Tax=Heracleum sosnowskyi TaxID=360622 RepID=A0AAD8JFG6_9APIA|nr:Ankyrin repeat family protein [Heracleum sosnowskyi]